jgi:hypothetical protein
MRVPVPFATTLNNAPRLGAVVGEDAQRAVVPGMSLPRPLGTRARKTLRVRLAAKVDLPGLLRGLNALGEAAGLQRERSFTVRRSCGNDRPGAGAPDRPVHAAASALAVAVVTAACRPA